MSYKLVDAVNQQIPETVNATEMLILTKFAELVVKPEKPFRRVGKPRFLAMTHLQDKGLRNNLNSLHEKGFLVCMEDRKKKHLGDRPALYELRLPDVFDEATVKARHDKYYFGKPFMPEYFEDNDEFNKPSGSLPPVMRNDGLDEKAETLDEKAETLDQKRPSQVSGSQVFFIPDDDDVVKAAKEEAAKATGSRPSAFGKCGITAENAPLVRNVIEGFVAFRQARPDYTIRSPVGFLIDRIKTAIANGTTEGLFGELPKANDATDEAKAKFEAVWKKVVDKMNLAATGKDLLRSVRGEFECKFGKKFGPNKTFDAAALNGICTKVMSKDTDDPDERARELSSEINEFCNS